MNRSIMRIMAGALALAGATVASVEAEAMPVQSLAPAVTTGTAVEKAYLVCGPFRCFRRGWGWAASLLRLASPLWLAPVVT